jgi:hypothetical protein
MSAFRLAFVCVLPLMAAACAGPSPQSVQLAQERHSCASLGLDPASDAFSSCVGNLDATMFEANNATAR